MHKPYIELIIHIERPLSAREKRILRCVENLLNNVGAVRVVVTRPEPYEYHAETD